MKPKKISAYEIKAGTKEEHEHTKKTKVARKIAMDHLKKLPNYYNKKTGLPRMEKILAEGLKRKKKLKT